MKATGDLLHVARVAVGYPRSAHVIVLGNEKGGSGKSTTCMHIAVALLKAGQRVATIDLDTRQKSFTHYVDNRRAWAERAKLPLEMPTHYCVARGEGAKLQDNEAPEFNDFAAGDRPPSSTATISSSSIRRATDSYLMRLAHSMADTLVTPLNDSFVDFDVLGTVDPTTFAVTGISHYAEMVREARRQRRIVDGRLYRLDRGAQPPLAARLAQQEGWSARASTSSACSSASAWRTASPSGWSIGSSFPRGLTALDELDEATLGTRPSLSHVTARQEVRALLDGLKLPVDEKGRRRAAARAEWFASADKPLDLHDIVAGVTA